MLQQATITFAVVFTIACSAANAAGHRGGHGIQKTGERKAGIAADSRLSC